MSRPLARNSWPGGSQSRRITTTVTLGILLTLAGSIRPDPSTAQERTVECGTKVPKRPGEPGGIARANLSLAEGELTTFTFGRSRRPDTFEIQFEVDNCFFRPGQLAVTPRIFGRGGAAIPREDVSVSAHAEREFVILSVGVSPGEVDPGAYIGEVLFFGGRVNRFELPLTIEFQFGNWVLLAVLTGAIVLLVGTFLVWASGALARGEWQKTAAKIAFAIAAAGAAYYAGYWRNPTWGADGWDFILLTGAMLTAYMSALTASSAVGGRSTGTPAGEH
jgi:hypothetical protein